MIRGKNIIKIVDEEIELPLADNTAEALQIYRAANERFRETPWPKPFDRTTHFRSEMPATFPGSPMRRFTLW